MITQDELKQHLWYESGTGLFYWRKMRQKRDMTKPAGSRHKDGYWTIMIDGKNYLAHRLAWLWEHGVFPEALDHIDCNRDNNRLNNLRIASVSQNAANTGKRVDNTSGFRGISWNFQRQLWDVRVQFEHKIYRAKFRELGQAVAWYEATARAVYGEFYQPSDQA